MSPELSIYNRCDVRARFRRELRDARLAAGRDSEGFQEIVFTIERLGRLAKPNVRGLGALKGTLDSLARKSALTDGPDDAWPRSTPFDVLFDMVVDGRNDALHQGAVARNLTRHAIELSLILEHALMPIDRRVSDCMAPNPVCAQLWEPISSVRRTMLLNQFSVLPVKCSDGWKYLSDEAVAKYLAENRAKKARTPLEQALGELRPPEATTCYQDKKVDDILKSNLTLPILVMQSGTDQLVGILTAHDVL